MSCEISKLCEGSGGVAVGVIRVVAIFKAEILRCCDVGAKEVEMGVEIILLEIVNP